MNQKVNDFVNGVIEEKAVVTHIDYESNSAFNQYKSYVITATLYESIDKINPLNVVKTEQLFIHFDKDTFIELDDCLRGKAISKVAKENGATEEELKLSKITETGVEIDVLGKKVNYPYDETSFVMKNENIKTLLKGDRIEIPKREIDPNKPMVAFTFDDGPSSDSTSQILEIVNKNKVKATFFVLGSNVDARPELVKQESADHQAKLTGLGEKDKEDIVFGIEENVDFTLEDGFRR